MWSGRPSGRPVMPCDEVAMDRSLISNSVRIALLLVSTAGAGVLAQRPAPIVQDPLTVPLWQGKAPGALGEADEDIPTLTIYMPANTTGPLTAVVVAPGGGYAHLSMNLEGRLPANYLNTLGVAAFVLK